MLKQRRGDDALHVDTAYCDAQFGAPQNGTVTSRQYKSCMRARGWRFSRTIREPRRRDDGYPDPDNPGLVCHDFHDRRGHRIELLELLSCVARTRSRKTPGGIAAGRGLQGLIEGVRTRRE